MLWYNTEDGRSGGWRMEERWPTGELRVAKIQANGKELRFMRRELSGIPYPTREGVTAQWTGVLAQYIFDQLYYLTRALGWR